MKNGTTLLKAGVKIKKINLNKTYSSAKFNFVPVKDSVIKKLILENYALKKQVNCLNNSYLDILDNLNDIFYLVDTNWNVTYTNQVAEKIFSVSKEQIIGKNIWDTFPEYISSRLYFTLQRCMKERIPGTIQLKGNYTSNWFEIKAFPFINGISVIFRNITLDKELKEQELNLSHILDSSNDAIILADLDFNITVWNQGAKNSFGYMSEEILGKSLEILVPKNKKLAFRDYLNKVLTGEEFDHEEGKGLRKDGSEFDISISVFTLQDTNLEAKGVCAIIRDISEKTIIEKEMLRLDRLDLIGQMAAGLGHEIRNPMTTVSGFLQLLLEKDYYQRDHSYFRLMIDELNRANSIITEFLSLANNKTTNKKSQNLNDILTTLYPLITAEANKADKFINLDLTDVPNLQLDNKEIKQLILNLVKNGLEAMNKGGVLNISTYPWKNRVVLKVKDQGPGISNDIIDKIGTPFFTTKETGTGLGLAISYSIAHRHNAKITIDSNSSGTAFKVNFPVTVN